MAETRLSRRNPARRKVGRQHQDRDRGGKGQGHKVLGKKAANGNGDKGQTHFGAEDLRRAIYGMGPSNTVSLGPGDLDHIVQEADRISKAGQ